MEDDEDDFEREQADYEQAELERLGRLTARLRRKGICVHGHRQAYTAAFRPDLKPGQVECLECHKIAPAEELDAERDRYLL